LKSVKTRLRYGDFSKTAAVRHLGFFYVCVWTTQKGQLVVFITMQNLARIEQQF